MFFSIQFEEFNFIHMSFIYICYSYYSYCLHLIILNYPFEINKNELFAYVIY